jgi:hypothetical protein
MPGAGRTHGPPATKVAGGSDHRFSRNNRHSPRNGFTAYTSSPRRPGLIAAVPPGSTRGLTPASGCRDRTISPSALFAFVSRKQRVHRIPHPTLVTIAKRPSDRARDGVNHKTDLRFGKSEIFFI